MELTQTTKHEQVSHQIAAKIFGSPDLEAQNTFLRQQVAVLEQNERILLAKLESQQRKQERERHKWEEQMGRMQKEVMQLNVLLTQITP